MHCPISHVLLSIGVNAAQYCSGRPILRTFLLSTECEPLPNETFKDAGFMIQQLFKVIETKSDSIDSNVIDKFRNFVKPRCQVCIMHNGDSVNCRWREMHTPHHPKAADDRGTDAEFQQTQNIRS
jgi:hypothetical protein